MSILDEDTRPANQSHLNRFLTWIHKQPGWENAGPRDLLVRSLEAEDNYEVLDVVQKYITGLVLRKSSKRKAYSVLRSFFAHNRCGLPSDLTFRIRGNLPPVQGKLTANDIREAALASKLRYRSMILFKWQGFLDNSRLINVNNHCGTQVLEQLQAGVSPIRVDIPGRKSSEYDTEGDYFTFVGDDSVAALGEYFENERGLRE